MRERHLRYVTVLTWLACMVTVGVAAAPAERPLEATAVHPVVGAASDACLIPAGFLQGLVASQPEDAFAVLFLAFPIDPSAQTRFRERVLSACERVGPVTGFDLLGCRSLPDCTRYFQILFLTHHPVQPVAWEFTMYRPRPDGPWQVNFVRFESDAIFDFIALPMLDFDRLTGPDLPKPASPHPPSGL